eukprot:TRINITY_DN13151_c0_g1_i1.p1 TRINITY_DN13151_c0_g1~~TRINITY_DN13151_c0_g1_i1.p1  ORF type:complete len:269 (-),score=33.09 TRINITY_DN13151_c0_g1_i1:79-837(-)
MNGKMIGGKPLYVALAQRKEVRRAYLEAQMMARNRTTNPNLHIYPHAPFFFPQGVARPGGFMYPQAMNMTPQRWPMPGGLPSMNMHPVPPRVPQSPYGPQPPGQPLARAPGRGSRTQSHPKNPQASGGRGRSHPNIRYTSNARNQHASSQFVQPSIPPTIPSQTAVPAVLVGQEPLTIEVLAAAPPEVQKRMIGERLFPLIQSKQPQPAGKITGMLLEMDNGELLTLLETPSTLNEKIEEAVQVLADHTRHE